MQFILLGMTLSIRQAFQLPWCNLLGRGKRNIPFIFVLRFDGEALLLVISLHYKLLEIYLGFLIWDSLNFSFLYSFVRQTARVVEQTRGVVVTFF